MPIPRNWSEELISEWLQLMQYMTEVGVPVGVGAGSGPNKTYAKLIGTFCISGVKRIGWAAETSQGRLSPSLWLRLVYQGISAGEWP